jgi:signal transduction histidine kinase
VNLIKSRHRITSLIFCQDSQFHESIVQQNSTSATSLTFPILSQLEWIILGFTAITGGITALILSFPKMAIVIIFSVIALALMRFLGLPQKITNKPFFTALDFAVVLLPLILDSRIQIVLPLLLVIVIRGCQMYKSPGRLAVVILAFLAFLLTIGTSEVPLPLRISETVRTVEKFSDIAIMMRLNAVLAFGLALTFTLLLINALLEERQSRTKLAAVHEQLRQYALQIEDQSALQERNRIAREIHDSLGHTLTAQSIQLDSALLLLKTNSEKANDFLQASKQLCAQALQEVRQSVSALRSDSLQGKSLDAAIATLVQDFRTTSAISSNYAIYYTTPIPKPIGAALYRILQEALTNITRHSGATQTMIRVFEKNQRVCLVIKDNGKGFNPDQNSTGFGLQSMRERTAALGGRFTLLSQPGEGCLISIQLPLASVAL